MFETVIVDQNPHWDGTQYDGGVPRSVLEEVKKKEYAVTVRNKTMID